MEAKQSDLQKDKRMNFHKTWFIGKLEIGWWNDTGTPPFRVYFSKYKETTYSVCIYKWIMKFFLYKRTLWISLCGDGHRRFADAKKEKENRK